MDGWMYGWKEVLEHQHTREALLCVLGGVGMKALPINTITKEEKKKE